MTENINKKGIAYSCYYNTSRDGENFVAEHTLSYQFSGSLILNDGHTEYPSSIGSLRLIRRNQLMKFVKKPAEDDAFKSISIYLDQETLQHFAQEHHIRTSSGQVKKPVMNLTSTPLLEKYIHSINDYLQAGSFDDKALVEVKLKEGILLLIKSNSEVVDVLFDFSEPYKANLESFMNLNYHFNVKLERFAYMTGRSLATFKRDFEKQFGTSPGKWIMHKRLDEAYRLIAEKGRSGSEVYLDLGFEDMSHFSFAFKKQFGVSPSKVVVKL